MLVLLCLDWPRQSSLTTLPVDSSLSQSVSFALLLPLIPHFHYLLAISGPYRSRARPLLVPFDPSVTMQTL